MRQNKHEQTHIKWFPKFPFVKGLKGMVPEIRHMEG